MRLWWPFILGGTGFWMLACMGNPNTNSAPSSSSDSAPATLDSSPKSPEPSPVKQHQVVNIDIDILPLRVGHKWTYELVEHRGSGPRFIGLTNEKATSTQVETLVLEITKELKDERHAVKAKITRSPVEGLPSNTDLTLWKKGDEVWMDAGNGKKLAIEAKIPPYPVSAERIPCIANILGGYPGTCAPVPGGPLGTSPGVSQAVVLDGQNGGAEAARFLVGIMTAGIFIPGNKAPRQVLSLVSLETAEADSNRYTAKPPVQLTSWEALGPKAIPKQLAHIVDLHGADLEAVTAVLAGHNEGMERAATRDLAAAVMPYFPPEERFTVARVALQTQSDSRIQTLATVFPHLPSPVIEPYLSSTLEQLASDEERAQAVKMFTFDIPLFIAFAAENDGDFDEDSVNLLKQIIGDFGVTPLDAELVAQQFSFDTGKSAALEVMLAQAGESERPRIVAAVLTQISFDEARYEILQKHADQVSGLSRKERQVILDEFTFDPHKASAKVALGL